MNVKNEIWTEKYRPKKFQEILGQTEIVSRINALVKKQNLPHLLFSGPPGVGKSTIALVIARELFQENWNRNFLELNASDSRGIDVVRSQVKDFARTKSIGDVPYKIIFLDECDALTKEAQQALRRTMENYTGTCRFILSCNYSSKIIDPIQSRCTVFRFKLLEKKDVIELINHISEQEKLEIEEKAKEALYNVSEGDCRRVANIMQSCSAINNKITENDVYSLASVAKPKEVLEFLTLAVKGDFLESRKKLLSTMLNYGLSGQDIIKQIHKEIWNLPIEDKKKIIMIDSCAEIEFRMTEGSDEFLQLEALLSKIVLVSKS